MRARGLGTHRHGKAAAKGLCLLGCNGARIQNYHFTRVNLTFSSSFNQLRDRYSVKMAELFGDWLKDEPKVFFTFCDATVQESKIITTDSL